MIKQYITYITFLFYYINVMAGLLVSPVFQFASLNALSLSNVDKGTQRDTLCLYSHRIV